MQYCGNLVVDAVLAEKCAECAAKGIGTRIQARLPKELPIDNAHLCSVFSNLLDNSISGSLESGADAPEICLDAFIKAGCMVVRCSNPAKKPARAKRELSPLRSHGLGLDILRQIAASYDGKLDTGYADGVYTTSLILNLGCAEYDEPQ